MVPRSHELSEDVVEDTTVLEVLNLGLSVETAGDGESLASARGHTDVLTDLEVATLHVNAEGLSAVEAKRVSVLAALELHGEDAHTNEVGSMDTLVALSNNSLDALKLRTLGSPITRGTRAVLVTGKDDGVDASLHVLVGSVENGHLLTGRNVHGLGADLVNELVDEADVGEGTTSHDLVVTSAGTVGVEVLGGNTLLLEVASSGRVGSNLTSRRDVISGDGVTDVKEHVGVLQALDGR